MTAPRYINGHLCPGEDCSFCEGLAEELAHPEPLSERDNAEWDGRQENTFNYWMEAS